MAPIRRVVHACVRRHAAYRLRRFALPHQHVEPPYTGYTGYTGQTVREGRQVEIDSPGREEEERAHTQHERHNTSANTVT